jgi:hypothetical protein
MVFEKVEDDAERELETLRFPDLYLHVRITEFPRMGGQRLLERSLRSLAFGCEARLMKKKQRHA